MGEVYRATDSNLKRSVAIKVLPAAVAGDADRLTRFQREAEVLAALNHPNIAAIYGLEKTADFTALVMELVEGDTTPISGDVRVEMVAVPVRTGGAAFEFDAAVPRFKVAIQESAVSAASDYDLTPDGRFLVGTGTPDTRTPPATIIFNWTEALKK